MDHQLTITHEEPGAQHRLGLLLGVAAWTLWGLFPLYFALLDDVPPLEVVAHRVVWTLVFLVVIISIARHWAGLRRAFNRRTFTILMGAAVFISINWRVYV